MDSTRTRPRLAVAAVLAGLWVLFGAGGSAAQDTTAGAVGVTEVRGVITPVIADHLDDAIEEADRRGLQALVIELDTPGGLAASMRLIIEDILNAPLPVIIHVTPA